MTPGAFCVYGIEMETEQIRGLYLVPPHGELIATGAKSAVVKSKYVPGHRLFDLRGDWMLVSKVDGVGLGLGDMTLGEPVEVSLDEFDTKEVEHRVERADRMRWWPEYETLWIYPVEGFKGYDEPLAVNVPAGVQTVMSNMEFQAESEKALTDITDGHFHALDSLDLQGSGLTEVSQNHYHEVQSFEVQETIDHSHLISEKARALFAAAQQSQARAQHKGDDIKHPSVTLGSPATVGTGVKAQPNRSRCMECKSPPVIDVHWADGRGRAWFCLKHFKEWIEGNDREIVRAFYLSDGEVPIKIGEGEQVRKLGERLSQEALVERVESLIVAKTEPETKETDMQEITVLLDDEQLVGEKGNPYSKMSEVNPSLRGIKPPISLEQANLVASWADAMESAEDGPESPWGASIAQFKELYEKNEAGDGWTKRDESDSKAKWSATYISSLPDTAFLLIESGGEKKDGITRPLSLRHLPVRGKDGEIDPGHLRNALARMSQMKDKDGESFPAATIEKLREKARKLLAESKKARGEGQGVGSERQGDSGTGHCICPKCDHVVEHERGTPCNEVKCEKCGEPMRGATEAEIEAAGVQADRAVVAAVATGVDAAVKAGRFRTLSDGRRVQITGRAFTASGGKSGWFGSGPTEGESLTEKQGEFLDTLLKSDEESRDRTRSSNDSQNLNRYFGDSTWRQFKKDHLGRGALSPEDRVRFREDSSQAMKKFDRDVSTWLSVASSANLSKTGASRAISALKDGHSGGYLQLRFGSDAAAKTSYLKDLFGTKEVESQKEGRRVRQDKVGLLQKLKDELAEFLASLGEFVSWATYDDKPKDSAPEEFNLSTLLDIAGKKALEQGSTAFAFKALDGTTWWFQWTTNAFKDREGEIFTTQSISDFVDRKEHQDVKGEFWFWHTPGSKFGTVRLQAIVGRFLAQAGPFDDTAVGRAFKEFFSAHPHSHPDIAPEGWGTSHGYSYKSTDRAVDGVYNWFDIRESTVLPRRFASNPYSPMPQILQEVKQMNDEQRKAFAAIGGDDFVNLITDIGKESTKKLEGEVDFKEAAPEDEKAGGNYAARVKEIAKGIEDDTLRGQVEVFCAKLEEAIPVAKKEDETDESEKATDMSALAGQLRMLAGKVGGDAGKNLAAIAEEMATASDKKEDEDAETTTKVEPEAEKAVEAEVNVLTREEVAGAMKAVVEVLREEIKGTTETTVAEIAKALEPLVAEVKSLKKSDEVKVAEKAAETPAASLGSLLQSVIGNKATFVEADSKLAKSGPKETAAPTDGFTGIPFVDAFIGETDQSAAGGN